jgi:hypothetical protein
MPIPSFKSNTILKNVDLGVVSPVEGIVDAYRQMSQVTKEAPDLPNISLMAVRIRQFSCLLQLPRFLSMLPGLRLSLLILAKGNLKD